MTLAGLMLGWLVFASVMGSVTGARRGLFGIGEAHALSRPALTRFQYTQLHMGVQVRIVCYARDEAQATRACRAAFARFAELEAIMSDYRADSELMQLCARAGGSPVRVSRPLFVVLEKAQEMSRLSAGGFDVTVGPFVTLWRKARKSGVFPSAEELEAARKRVGWEKIRLNRARQTVQLLVPGMRLDLGGIAKGYAGDQAQEVLKRHGVTRALVEAGGDIVVSDPPPGESGWNIEVQNPGKGEMPRVFTLANRAISSSGDTAQFVEFEGKRYSHIVDPRTGVGLTDRVAVTVIAPQGAVTDALSTAISVVGEERGRALAKRYPGVVLYIRQVDPTRQEPAAPVTPPEPPVKSITN